MLSDHLDLLICPDCKQKLIKIEVKKVIVALSCKKCELIYPIKDSIPIVLSRNARNSKLERPLVGNIKHDEVDSALLASDIKKYIQNTLNLLALSGNKSWEWEDEEFWSREYEVEKLAIVPKNWNTRMWQREQLVKELTGRLNLKGKTILDVGSGEGQNFRLLLSRYCNQNTLYIAADISFSALKINRERNAHKNSLYILCSEDYVLPLMENSVDILCYFGILHHTKNKTENIQKDITILRKGGYIALTETIDRPTLCTFKSTEKSAHEEHIKKAGFLQTVNKNKLSVCFYREEETPFYTSLVLFRTAFSSQKKLYLVALKFDRIIAKTIGRILPLFSAGTIQALAKYE